MKQSDQSSAQSQQQPIRQPYASNKQKTASKSSIREKIKTVLEVAAIFAVAAIIVYKQISDMQPTANQSSGTLSKDTYRECEEPQGMDEEIFPFYALLTDNEKTIYEETLEYIENGDSGFIPSYEFGEATITKMLHYIYYEQPQLFWFDPDETRFVVDSNTGKVSEIMIGYSRSFGYRSRAIFPRLYLQKRYLYVRHI